MALNDSYTHDNLFSGDYPLKTEPVTVLSGENVVRGELMGRITVGGRYRACNINLVDGAEECDGIMTADVDASAADTPGIVYLTGSFNTNGLTISVAAGADTVAAHKVEARLRGIFFTGYASVTGCIV